MRPWALLAIAMVGCSSKTDVPANGADSGYDPVGAFDVGELDAEDFFDVGFTSPPSRLELGPTVISTPPPPPISGGTLIIAGDGHTAIASDPDRDRVWFVDLDTRTISKTTLERGDEPGRVVEDDKGHVYVALRQGGAVATIDRVTHAVIARDEVCPAPRGLAFASGNHTLHVACAGGELVSIDTETGVHATTHLGPDLRDVVVTGSDVYVTRFRSGEVSKIGPGGFIVSTSHVPTTPATRPNTVAWRALPSPGGGIAVLHQRATTNAVAVSAGGYGSPTCGPVTAAVSNIGGTLGSFAGTSLPGAFHAVDFALAPDGKSAVVVAPGGTHVKGGTQIFRVALDGKNVDCSSSSSSVARGRIEGEPTAVAFTKGGMLVVQSRQPAALIIDGEPLRLPGEDRIDTGHMIFHGGSGFGIACVSCHVEGGEDGVAWTFGGVGTRRTQSLRGHVLARAPFHWDGSLPTFTSLVDDVFVHRMLGPPLEPSQLAALARYVDSIPELVASPTEATSVGLGRVVFDSKCTGCHSGPTFTDGALHDVGTGGLFKTPSLRGVSFRAPFLHDGCAETLEARFDRCGGGDAHGGTSSLEPIQIQNLVAYLQSL